MLADISFVVFLCISRKRTLSKIHAFDLVVTITLGSPLATVLLNKDVALAEGVLAFALLIGLQFVVRWSSVRARWVWLWATGEPLILLYHLEFQAAALRRERVAEDEVRASVRAVAAGVGFEKMPGDGRLFGRAEEADSDWPAACAATDAGASEPNLPYLPAEGLFPGWPCPVFPVKNDVVGRYAAVKVRQVEFPS
jgi:hypothetical protein